MKTERTRLRREPQKACYDRDSLNRLLDAVPLCHVAYVHNGHPYATPTLQWREGDHVYWHGSSASRAIRACDDAPVCLTVTRVDGFVLARSAFEHSMNFQSAMIIGVARRIIDPARKSAHLKRFVQSLFPGRWPELRLMTDQELKATAVMRLPLEECSVKLRSGPPNEPEADRAHPVWGGIVPVAWTTGAPQPDADNKVTLPDYLKSFTFGACQ